MRSLRGKLLAAAFLSTAIGCEPKPVADEPAANSTVDVDVSGEGVEVKRNRVDEDGGVDVRVGGGDGVQIEVDSKE